MTKRTEPLSKLLGVGLYNVAEAAAITGIKPADIRRWLFGYEEKGRFHSGLWKSELSKFGDNALGFRDLLEIRFVNAFRSHGISLQSIRLAWNNAREICDTDYPFTCKQFHTDGKSIFASIQEEAKDEILIDLGRRQYAFQSIISPALYHGIEYFNDRKALRWFPLKNSKKVVLDPARNFGSPILANEGIRTDVLYRAYVAEGEDARKVADLYGISTVSVKAAVRFERREAA